MFHFPTIWTENNAETLLNICAKFCIKNPLTFSTFTLSNAEYQLREGLSLPEEICECMLAIYKTEQNNDSLNKFIHLFKDNTRTRLQKVDLSDTLIEDEGFEIITRHNITELNVSHCKKLTKNSLNLLNRLQNSLHSLLIGNSMQIIIHDNTNRKTEEHLANHTLGLFSNEAGLIPFDSSNLILELPKLRKLIINSIQAKEDVVCLNRLINSTKFLTYLDLSWCQDIGDISYLKFQKNLTSLILHDVPDLQNHIFLICQVKSLRHLDISYSDENIVKYKNPNATLKHIVESLPNLVSLDISGTNLAGNRTQERETSSNEELSFKDEIALTDIPGLKSRVQKPLEFLGLYNTAHEACFRHHIPSKKIAGDANEEQILTAGQVYCAREVMIQKVLNDLFHIFRYDVCHNTRLALDVVMEAMRLHLKVKHIQVSGSASLFYIVKGEDKYHFNIRIKRRIIKALLDAMFAHSSDITMIRNGCLTLIHFKIPEDVFFDYERLVSLLLVIVAQDDQDEFVQRIGVFLLNSLACQVDGLQKQLVGDRGAIMIMLQIIENRLHRHVCDEVMEIAWSTMWNVTDETPVNCARFLEGKGMDLFLGCLQAFPEKPELLRNMMGLLGNVAEVKELRPSLMKDEYLSVFSELLGSKSDGIEVSYNAAGILSHIASDGPDLWDEHNISSVKRQEVLQRMVGAIEEWNLDTKRNINYRSFEPILRLLSVEHTPEAQHWAVWALANLTRVYPSKYCFLLEEESGIEMLKKLLEKPSYPRIYELAEIIIQQCQNYTRCKNLDYDPTDYQISDVV